MGYAVFHRDDAGTPTVEDVPSLEVALEIVERSRNGEGPRDVRVFREVPIEVRTYYKVPVAEEVEAPAAGADASVPAEAAEVDAVEDDDPLPDAAAHREVVAEDPVVAEVPVAAAAPVVADVLRESAATDEPYDVRRLLEPAPGADAKHPAAPPAPLPGAFPLAGPAVQQPTVEVHAANLEDEDSHGKRHSLFGRGG